jgi:putative flavoprotein involved in K+ transport
MSQAVPAGPGAVSDWIVRFETALRSPARAQWDEVFAEESYWRDLLAFTWNIITLEGPAAIATMAGEQSTLISARDFSVAESSLPMTDPSQGWFTFSTATARCRGHVQLRDGRAHVLLTAMVELIGHEECGGTRRPDGIEHRAQRGRRTWLEEREQSVRELGHSVQPWCLIVGGGQNGLMLAARLKRLGVPALVIDALQKPGDGWRARYRSLYLHDPIFLDHFPYLPFPDHWPLYPSKDKIAEWMEIYARAMEIDFWGRTICTGARYDEAQKEWTVQVMRDGAPLTLRTRQLVLATGLSGAKHIPAIPGADRFRGRQYHSADHGSGAGMAGQQCVVIGANNSAHDICVDLWEHEARVTMVQRSPTIVVRADTMREVSKNISYAQPGADVELSDLMFAANPFRPRTVFEKGFTSYLRQVDADFYARLEKSGFNLWDGEDQSGFFMAYYRRAAGYYIDVGGSELIASGEIPVRQGEVAEITADGVRLSDGNVLPADVIVYATGYRPMSEWVGQLISPEVEKKVGACWGLGSGTAGDPGPWEGELRNMWKPTAQQGLWFQGGNLMQARFHSLHLALQLKARLEGLPTPVYRHTAD